VLPKCIKNPAPVKDFIRNTLEIKDIEGTSPKSKYMYEIKKPENDINIKRKEIRKDNIKGYDYFDYSDIVKNQFISNRHTNPLEPMYNITYEDEFIGIIDKSKPSPLYKLVYKNPLNLQNNDIKGTQVGSLNKYKNFSSVDRFLNNKDIQGTQVGSLNIGLKTSRCLNPLEPNYMHPGISDDIEYEKKLKFMQEKNHEEFLAQKEMNMAYINEMNKEKIIRPHLKEREGYDGEDIKNLDVKKSTKNISMKRPMSSNIISRNKVNNLNLNDNNISEIKKNPKMENLINKINDFEKRNKHEKEKIKENKENNNNYNNIDNINVNFDLNNNDINNDNNNNVNQDFVEKKKIKFLDKDIYNENFNKNYDILKEKA
jgi:hypothetical protein